MKPTITLNTTPAKESVPIYIEHDIFSKIANIASCDKYTHVGILMDKNVAKYWGKAIQKALGKEAVYMEIPAGEEYKTLSTVEDILTSMLAHRFDRKSLLINIGGGVVCDMGGFAASIYMRGISFINVPTTLLAQTDAAIGGKTGIDFAGFKNMLGSFAQPQAIICDTLFLSTLPQKEFRSGFAEVIKHALVYDKKFLSTLSKKNFGINNGVDLTKILSHSCTIKCAIVTKDPHEKGLRKILNFGHTIGHALEMISHETKKPLLHGEAISIGMIAEARLSLLAGLLTKKDFESVEAIIGKAGLPTKIKSSYKKTIYAKMLGDKKNEKRQLKWVLLKGIGEAIFDKEQPETLVNKAIDYILE
jgi:3-dehydroquinate synthase